MRGSIQSLTLDVCGVLQSAREAREEMAGRIGDFLNSNPQGVVVIPDLSQSNMFVAQAYHHLCDTQAAPYPEATFLFAMEGASESRGSARQRFLNARQMLVDKWKEGGSGAEDMVRALVGRISGLPLAFK